MRLWLRGYREKVGLTQEDIAEKLGISQNYYADIENGKRQADMNLSLAAKLADFFNIPLSAIRNFEEELLLQDKRGA